MGVPVLEPLVRVRATKPQWSLGKDQRVKNIANAFSAVRAGDAFGKHLVLLDDVCTTGASLEACATELIQAGARSVSAYVFAREI
jgi:predicted amidophosphoribosyltransferase